MYFYIAPLNHIERDARVKNNVPSKHPSGRFTLILGPSPLSHLSLFSLTRETPTHVDSTGKLKLGDNLKCIPYKFIKYKIILKLIHDILGDEITGNVKRPASHWYIWNINDFSKWRNNWIMSDASPCEMYGYMHRLIPPWNAICRDTLKNIQGGGRGIVYTVKVSNMRYQAILQTRSRF